MALARQHTTVSEEEDAEANRESPIFDSFYNADPDTWKLWAKYGVLAVEMEAAALYTAAARFGVKALCLLTVSDSLVSDEDTTAEEREKTFTAMMELALETAIRVEVPG